MGWASSTDVKNEKYIFVENPEGRKPCRTCRRRWADRMRMDLSQVGREVVEQIHLA
jgi:hypothetical protein